ncbi:MAG: hypothetical protein AB7V50_05005 [Vampirovibrionia bacterium]
MIKNKVLITLSIYLLFISPCVLGKAEYDSLPLLDGRVDNAPLNIRKQINRLPEPEKEEASNEKPKLEMQKPPPPDGGRPPKDHFNKMPPPKENKIASNSSSSPAKNSIAAIDSPKLDIIKPDIKKSNKMDMIRFTKYETELNKVLTELSSLTKTIDEGTVVQVYSAKATSAKFINDIFVSKYENTEESQLESYKIVQNIIKDIVFVRDYWIDSNKIKYNQKGIPDKIIQTKFLKISTNVDKLIELMNINNSLEEE